MLLIHKQNFKETVFNYCVQWSSVVDQETDSSTISMGAMYYTIYLPLLKQMASTKNRSSHPKVFYRKSVLKNFAKFTGKH